MITVNRDVTPVPGLSDSDNVTVTWPRHALAVTV